MHRTRHVYYAHVKPTKTAPTQPRPTAPTATPATTDRPGILVAVLAAAGIVVSLAQTLVVPILGELPRIFDTSASNTSWIITVTLLVAAVSTPIAGRLADMYGKKRIMLIALIPFIAGSIVGAIATDVVVMIIGRGLQGLGSAMIPLGISLMHDLLPPDKVGSAIALMSSSMGIGGALGLPLAAAVTQFSNWRVLFWATAAAAALLALALALLVPAASPPAGAKRFDYVGALGLTVGLSTLLLAISKGSAWGWTSLPTLVCAAVSLVSLLLWGRYEFGHASPLIDLRLAASRVVLLTNMASVLIGFSMYAMNLILPQVIQLPTDLGYGLGRSMLEMGLWMAPMGLGMFAVSRLGAGVSRAHGPKTTLAWAGIVIALGYGITALVLATLGDRGPGPADGGQITLTLVTLTLGATITGCGIGLAYGSMPALILGAVPPGDKASANSVNALMRSLGTSVSAAVIGVILASMSAELGGHPVPSLGGFVVALLIGCGSALAASAVTVAIPGRGAAARAR